MSNDKQQVIDMADFIKALFPGLQVSTDGKGIEINAKSKSDSVTVTEDDGEY